MEFQLVMEFLHGELTVDEQRGVVLAAYYRDQLDEEGLLKVFEDYPVIARDEQFMAQILSRRHAAPLVSKALDMPFIQNEPGIRKKLILAGLDMMSTRESTYQLLKKNRGWFQDQGLATELMHKHAKLLLAFSDDVNPAVREELVQQLLPNSYYHSRLREVLERHPELLENQNIRSIALASFPSIAKQYLEKAFIAPKSESVPDEEKHALAEQLVNHFSLEMLASLERRGLNNFPILWLRPVRNRDGNQIGYEAGIRAVTRNTIKVFCPLALVRTFPKDRLEADMDLRLRLRKNKNRDEAVGEITAF